MASAAVQAAKEFWLRHDVLHWVQAVVSVLGVRMIASGAAFLGNILVARTLDPGAFGAFYLLFTVMTLVAGLSGPAIDTTLVRFAARNISPDRDDSLPYFKVVLYLKLAILVVTMVAGVAAAPWILHQFFRETTAPVSTWEVVAAFAGGAAVSIWGYSQSYFQSHQQFTKYASFEFFSSTLRLCGVAVLALFQYKLVAYYIGVYIAAPLTMAVISWLILPRKIYQAKATMADVREVLQFAKWVVIATIFTTLTQRLDLLLLGSFYETVPKHVIGCYAAAVSLVLVGELVLLTLYNVLLPKASALKGPGELRRFIGHFRVPSMFFCLAMSLLIPFSGPLCRLFFKPIYIGVESYFVILYLGVLVTVSCAPAVTALYSLGRSQFIAGFEGARFILTLLIGLWAVQQYGAYGMAWTMTGVRAVMSVVTYVVAHQEVKRLMIKEWTNGV